MSSHKKFLLIAALAVVILLIGANWQQVKAAIPKITGDPGGSSSTDKTGAGGSTTTRTGSGAGAGPVKVGNDYNLVLKKGSSGTEVTELQALLNRVNAYYKHFAYNLVVDGQFGSKTELMLKYYNGNRGSITLNEAYTRMQQFAAKSF